MAEQTLESSAAIADKISSEKMEVETNSGEESAAVNGSEKRPREEEEKPDNGDALKKAKVQSSEEEKKGENLEEKNGAEDSGRVDLGPKSFGSSVEMFDYFLKFLHSWSSNVSVNKYEHMMLLELLKKGHAEPERKIGNGVKGFQVRLHPKFKSRCFFIIREDGSVDDFSFRKCVDNILPLPEDMAIKHYMNKGDRGGGRGGRRGGGRGRGSGGRGKWRN